MLRTWWTRLAGKVWFCHTRISSRTRSVPWPACRAHRRNDPRNEPRWWRDDTTLTNKRLHRGHASRLPTLSVYCWWTVNLLPMWSSCDKHFWHYCVMLLSYSLSAGHLTCTESLHVITYELQWIHGDCLGTSESWGIWHASVNWPKIGKIIVRNCCNFLFESAPILTE